MNPLVIVFLVAGAVLGLAAMATLSGERRKPKPTPLRPISERRSRHLWIVDREEP